MAATSGHFFYLNFIIRNDSFISFRQYLSLNFVSYQKRKMKGKHILYLALCIVGVLGIGSLGGLATASSIETWYAQLNVPSFNPPNWIFGPVWTLLYLLMGISLFRIITAETHKPKWKAYLIFGLQLALNFAWSFIFFYFHALGWALVEIYVLAISILAMLFAFYQIDKWAAWMNIPYLLWVLFASFLNYNIYVLN